MRRHVQCTQTQPRLPVSVVSADFAPPRRATVFPLAVSSDSNGGVRGRTGRKTCPRDASALAGEMGRAVSGASPKTSLTALCLSLVGERFRVIPGFR